MGRSIDAKRLLPRFDQVDPPSLSARAAQIVTRSTLVVFRLFYAISILATSLCLGSCGKPKPKTVTTEDGRQALELPYCLDATDCFTAADEACPRGYETIRWQASRPHIIICH